MTLVTIGANCCVFFCVKEQYIDRGMVGADEASEANKALLG